ncbi:MAG: cation-transporting P-type ATPase [Rhodocyclaceae bacterium]|nr:cation-transporting P-type ATPase [Rhodocyclaceae bacterium]
MDIAQLSAEEALSSLRSHGEGLSSLEALRRQKEFGPNRVEELRGEPDWLKFARQFTHFFALLLWLAAGLSLAAEWYQPGQGMGRLALAVVAVILVNGVFSFWQEYRAGRAIAALCRLLPWEVRVMREGSLRTLPAEELVPGDIVLVEEGDDVPADCRLVESWGLKVNAATLTGESRPLGRRAEAEQDGGNVLSVRNLLLAGTSIISGQGRAVVFATGMRTEFGRIAHLTQSAGDTDSPLQKEIVRLSRLVGGVALALGVMFFLVGHALGLPFWLSFMFAIGVIVANVPEGLLPTVTLALAMATQKMAKRNALVRHLPAVETLGCTTVIVSDKTGTLTENRMAVRRLYAAGSFVAPHAWRKGLETRLRFRPMVHAALQCHNLKMMAHEGGARLSGDPTEIALVEWAMSVAKPSTPLSLLGEIPFDGERRRMSVVVEERGSRTLYCKGAPESLLAVCDRYETAKGPRPLTQEARMRLLAAHDEMAGRGLRVLAFAYGRLPDSAPISPAAETGLVLTGLAGLEDPPRPEVHEAITRCRLAGIKVIMATGDHPATALSIAREIGLVRGPSPRILLGEDLHRLTDTELLLALDAPEVIAARVSAEQKMRLVQALQARGEVVAVTGDGVNDAPALKSADIGVAMGRSGTDVAREASDLVLLDDNFATIVAAIEEGRAVFDNLRKFCTYILTHTIPELVPYLAFGLLGLPPALTVMQILAVDLGTDTLPALALGAEPPDPAVMQRPPRGRNERLLDAGLLLRAYLFLGVIEAACAMGVFLFVMFRAGWTWERLRAGMPAVDDPTYLAATTACLAAIVVSQMANLLLCRHPSRGLLPLTLAGNHLLLWGMAFELFLLGAIAYTPWGRLIFGTAPLDGTVWLLALAGAALLVGLEEGRKALVRGIKPS